MPLQRLGQKDRDLGVLDLMAADKAETVDLISIDRCSEPHFGAINFNDNIVT